MILLRSPQISNHLIQAYISNIFQLASGTSPRRTQSSHFSSARIISSICLNQLLLQIFDHLAQPIVFFSQFGPYLCSLLPFQPQLFSKAKLLLLELFFESILDSLDLVYVAWLDIFKLGVYVFVGFFAWRICHRFSKLHLHDWYLIHVFVGLITQVCQLLCQTFYRFKQLLLIYLLFLTSLPLLIHLVLQFFAFESKILFQFLHFLKHLRRGRRVCFGGSFRRRNYLFGLLSL